MEFSSSAFYAAGSADIGTLAKEIIDKVSLAIKNIDYYPFSVDIEGHTDNVGSKEGNIQMSQMRAESVLNYFVSRGIPKGRFTVVGLGSIEPIADNKTSDGRAKNRRVEIIRVDK